MGGPKGGPAAAAGNKKSSAVRKGSLWLAANPSKRWGEGFFLIYTPFWLTLCLGIVVPFKLYERFTELEYLIVGLVSAVPAFIVPLFLVGKADSGKPLKDRYWVKANLWIIIFSYVGNYFWTHYFFSVLGASYTFPSWKMNNFAPVASLVYGTFGVAYISRLIRASCTCLHEDLNMTRYVLYYLAVTFRHVPHTTFLLTHSCFLLYHMASNITLRRLRHSVVDLPQPLRLSTEIAWILALSYFIAYLETMAISNFPYYDFVDREAMYKVGSLFYAIYFFVSFPMFSRVDEKDDSSWDLPRVAVDALGAAMLVTIILDLWRIFLGPIIPNTHSKQCIQPGLVWFHTPQTSV